MDPEESRDSLFDSGNIEDAAGTKQPAPAVIASLTPIKAPLEDSAKDAAREDPRKKLPAYTESDVDALLESDSGEIEHGAEIFHEHVACCSLVCVPDTNPMPFTLLRRARRIPCQGRCQAFPFQQVPCSALFLCPARQAQHGGHCQCDSGSSGLSTGSDSGPSS